MRRKINNKLKKIHIFDKVWCIGRPNKTGGHAVIYGPDDKEYDLDKQWVSYLLTFEDGGYYGEEEMTSRWNLGRVKAYILACIIDPGNWVFDTQTPPEVGSNVKVIYKNGTVKWIESFKGSFDDHVYEHKYKSPMRLNSEWVQYQSNIKNNNKEKPSQYVWEERTYDIKVLAWKVK